MYVQIKRYTYDLSGRKEQCIRINTLYILLTYVESDDLSKGKK